MRLRLIFLGLVASCAGLACKHAARIHPRAIEHNNYCSQYIAQGDLEKAETRCNLALEFNPDYPEPYCNLGLIALKRNQLDKAKKLFIKAIRLNQDFAEAHNDLGYVFLQQGSLGKAHDEFERALKVNPDYVEARYNLALTFLRMKRYPDARKAYDELIESNPNVADPHHDLCAMDIDEGDYGNAIRECKTAIRIDPKYTSAYFNLGNAFMKDGKFCEAQEAYTDCIRVDTSQAECRNNVTIATRKCALLDPNLKEAAAQPQPGGEAAPTDGSSMGADSANAWYRKGVAQVNAGLLNEARRSFNKCLRRNTQFALCYYQLYKLDIAVQDTASAQSDCKLMLQNSGDQQAQERDECRNFLATDGQQ